MIVLYVLKPPSTFIIFFYTKISFKKIITKAEQNIYEDAPNCSFFKKKILAESKHHSMCAADTIISIYDNDLFYFQNSFKIYTKTHHS